MENSGKYEKSSNKPKLRINLKDSDRRMGPKDRRKVLTYVADDRRSGIADRRKNPNKDNS
jgi:hypothetical protein